MANEITVIGRGPNGGYALFFRYDIPSPIQVAGTNVVPTPATPKPSAENPTPTPGDSLPEMVRRVIDPQDITDLDAGDAAYEIASFHPAVGMTNQQLIVKAQEIYAVRKAGYLALYARRFERSGVQISEV